MQGQVVGGCRLKQISLSSNDHPLIWNFSSPYGYSLLKMMSKRARGGGQPGGWGWRSSVARCERSCCQHRHRHKCTKSTERSAAAAHRITSCPLLLCCCELRGMRPTSMYTIACMAGTQVVLFRRGVGAFLILTYLEETDLNCGSRAS